MPPPLRLFVCLFLLTTCSALPTWHKGLNKQNDNQLLQVEAVDQKNHDSFENANTDEQDKTRSARQATNPFFFNMGGQLNFNKFPPQFQFSDRQNFGPPVDHQFQQPGLHPIEQLASTLQNIIGSRLEATIQQNNQVLFGTPGNIFPQPPGLRPLQTPFCPSCTHTQSFHETNHHFEIGHPQINLYGMHIQQFDINCQEGETGCRDNPAQMHPGAMIPLPSQPGKEIPHTRPSTVRPTTTTERQEFSDGNMDGEPHQEPAEEKVNLHHTFKDLQHSASKAVKDMHKYIHQQLNTVAKTSVEKIGKPLATVVLGPAILMKETLDALAGKRRPPPEEDISSWCPSCLENENVDHTQTQYHPQTIHQLPCYEPNCPEPDHSTVENTSPPQDAFHQETEKLENPPFASHDKPHQSDIIHPSKPNNESKGAETDIDIRFGNGSS